MVSRVGGYDRIEAEEEAVVECTPVVKCPNCGHQLHYTVAGHEEPAPSVILLGPTLESSRRGTTKNELI